MKKRISAKNLPLKSPLHLFATACLLLNHFHASQLIIGAVLSLFAIWIITWLLCLFNEKTEYVDIFEEK
jgi:hypothetical protein